MIDVRVLWSEVDKQIRIKIAPATDAAAQLILDHDTIQQLAGDSINRPYDPETTCRDIESALRVVIGSLVASRALYRRLDRKWDAA